MKNITFKNYNKSQLALPVELEVFIPDNHIVRIVDQIIDSIDISPLLELYKGGGSSAYHPKMLLKVIVYAYTQRIYSGRVIAKNLRENMMCTLSRTHLNYQHFFAYYFLYTLRDLSFLIFFVTYLHCKILCNQIYLFLTLLS